VTDDASEASFHSPSSRDFTPARLRPDPPPAAALLLAAARLDVPHSHGPVADTTIVRSWALTRTTRGRRPLAHGHGGSQAGDGRPRSSMSSSPAGHGTPLISPALRVRCLYFILLLLLQNREVAELHTWSGRPRPAGGGRAALPRRHPAGSQLSGHVCYAGGVSTTASPPPL
jgi:hypothetical protein